MYAKIENGVVTQYPYTMEDLRRDYPNTSFPASPSTEVFTEFGVVRVVVTGAPERDHATQKVVEGTPVFVSQRNRWEQLWEIKAASEQEITERNQAKAADIRSQRNNRISLCDWTQLPDAPVDKEAWATYRQALRDLTNQQGFPWDIQWPLSPDEETNGN